MNTTIKSFGALLIASLAISSCSDDFLKEKISYDQTTEDCYNYYSGAAGRVSDVYKWSQPAVNSGASWK